jgi:aspartate-semialdehyde dehydrogenase
MTKFSRKRVAIAGSTGMVGRRFAELLSRHPWYEIAMLVGYKSTKTSYGEVWRQKEATIRDHYGGDFWIMRPCPDQLKERRVQPIDDLFDAQDIDLVFSAIPPNVCHLEQRLLDNGYTLFSNSPYGRFEEDNPLVVAEVNGEEIRDQKFIKTPNCVSSGLALVLAPLKARYGLKNISVVTFQSLTGKGDAKYPRDLVVGNIYSLHKSDEGTEEYIRREVHKILREEVPVSVSCNRVYVQEGHLVDVKVNTIERIESESEIAELFRSFNPLRDLALPFCPAPPLVIINEAGRPRPRQDAFHSGGMAVAIGGISVRDEVFDLRLQFLVNNLIRGAAGGAVLNSDLYICKGKTG